MGSKNKLKRFKENETFPNVVQLSREEVFKNSKGLKGKWAENFFNNQNPIVLELGCGKGEYSLGLARRNPNKNYLGIDLKGARFWRGAKTALEEEIPNVGFLRSQIELVDDLFDENEIDEIWITFPDPQTKYRRTKHRMTNPIFLNKYRKIIKPGGKIHLKTDSEFMHGYTLGILSAMGEEIEISQHDIYKDPHLPAEVLEIQTYYEKQYLEIGKKITYLRFRLHR